MKEAKCKGFVAHAFCRRSWHGLCFRVCAMAEILKAIALDEFGTLEGLTISYEVNPETGRVSYCFTRDHPRDLAPAPQSLGPI